MKKVILVAIAAAGIMTAQAQQAYETPKFDHNWTFGIDGGGTTPIAHNYAFFKDMRGIVGVHLQKQISPAFALGVEGTWGVNTSSWDGPSRQVAFDDSYVGVYGGINLFNLFGGYKCEGRVFDIELVAGAGWGHQYAYDGPNDEEHKDFNYFGTRAGVNFNFNINKHITLAIKPSVNFNMTGNDYKPLGVAQTSAAYNRKFAVFNLMAGLSYHFGPTFKCVEAADPNEIAGLNKQINDLRDAIAAQAADQESLKARKADLIEQIEQARKPAPAPAPAAKDEQVMCVFYKVSSSAISRAQMTNVARVADFLKNNPEATVAIKGYASSDGPANFNQKLSVARAESVKKALVKKYGIAESRISTDGCGETDQLSERAWNRVSICTVND